jgi:REP element-mobilizing transposase RayT
MVLKQYTVNEHVEMARRYANRRSYEVDDDALLELYLQIDKMHATVENIKVDDVKEIINRAIEHSEKRASRKFFKGIKKKHTENGDFIYLTEADFKG